MVTDHNKKKEGLKNPSSNKELLQSKLDSIRSNYLKVSMQMNNIENFAKMNQLKVDWDKGIVNDK